MSILSVWKDTCWAASIRYLVSTSKHYPSSARLNVRYLYVQIIWSGPLSDPIWRVDFSQYFLYHRRSFFVELIENAWMKCSIRSLRVYEVNIVAAPSVTNGWRLTKASDFTLHDQPTKWESLWRRRSSHSNDIRCFSLLRCDHHLRGRHTSPLPDRSMPSAVASHSDPRRINNGDYYNRYTYQLTSLGSIMKNQLRWIHRDSLWSERERER